MDTNSILKDATVLIIHKNKDINPRMYILFGEKNEYIDYILKHEERGLEKIFYLDPKDKIPIIIDLEPIVEQNGVKYRTRLILKSIYTEPPTPPISTASVPVSQKEERIINLELPHKTTITLLRERTYIFVIDFEEIPQNK